MVFLEQRVFRLPVVVVVLLLLPCVTKLSPRVTPCKTTEFYIWNPTAEEDECYFFGGGGGAGKTHTRTLSLKLKRFRLVPVLGVLGNDQARSDGALLCRKVQVYIPQALRHIITQCLDHCLLHVS